MIDLSVYLEINGNQTKVGSIIGDNFRDAAFCYSNDYISQVDSRPISISLPLSEKAFSPEKTKNFFEGLLPEGFSRKAVANWIKTDEEDYLTILSVLGRECLGALKIINTYETDEKLRYELLSLERVKELAEEGATKSTQILMETHLSLTGASGKVGLYYDEKNDKWYLPHGDAPSTHIVKQSHVRFSKIIQNEQLCMLTAKGLGIDVPDSFIINLGDSSDSEILYATKRYDRNNSSENKYKDLTVPCRLHQEDFAQAMGISSNEKYEREKKGYLRNMFKVIRENVVDPISEQNKLWSQICFNFMIGNTDAHIKNFSLLYSNNLKGITLAPAYDIVSTRIYNMTNEMSMYIGDELSINKMDRKTFSDASKEVGLSERMAMKIFDDIANEFEYSIKEAAVVLAEQGISGVDELKDMIINNGGYAQIV